MFDAMKSTATKIETHKKISETDFDREDKFARGKEVLDYFDLRTAQVVPPQSQASAAKRELGSSDHSFFALSDCARALGNSTG
jgi:hypothetical protein